MKKLKELIDLLGNLTHKGSLDAEIFGLCSDSRKIKKGDLFIAKKGILLDGSSFIKEAFFRGASAILAEEFDPNIELPQLICPNVCQIEGKVASCFFCEPSKQIKVIGITGTNGKTTTSHLLAHLLNEAGMKTGLIGTLGYRVSDHFIEGQMTTPDPITIHSLLAQAVVNGFECVVMEVSSHGLDQFRVEGVEFDGAIFTNLSQDHLDYHKTLASYKQAKGRLFQKLEKGNWAIFNAGDKARFETKAKSLFYQIDKPNDLFAKDLVFSLDGTQFTFVYQGKEFSTHLPLIDSFNVSNALASLLAALCLRCDPSKLAEALKTFPPTPGRCERIENALGLNLFVDYAHTPDALTKAIRTMRPITKGKLIVVFGAGGDRDQSKRPLMGKAAMDADLIVLTSDNPRGEDPKKIAESILSGMDDRAVLVELDRKKAIELGFCKMEKGDTLLVTGKGHEMFQQTCDCAKPHSDSQVLKELVHC